MTTSQTAAGRSIPRDVSELLAAFEPEFARLLKDSGHGDKSTQLLAEELYQRGTLFNFELEEFLPPLLNVDQVLSLLGATWLQWSRWLYNARASELRPHPVIGKDYSKKAEFSSKDIVRIFRSPKSFSDAASVCPEETARAFKEYIRAASERVIYDWNQPQTTPKPIKSPVPAKPKKMSTTKTTTTPIRAQKPAGEVSFVGWPIGVPKNYDALYREYRSFVERTLLMYLKPCPSQQIEDVHQEMWMKIISSKTIEKFVAKARYRKIPEKLTAVEAVEYLGITWDQWLGLMRNELSWLQPVEGSVFSNSAIFTEEQVRNVEDSGLFPIVDAIPAEDMTKVFRGYLRNVIHNHFANYCRTRVRRFVKDTVVPDDNSRVIGGSKLGHAIEGDKTSWEDALVDYEGPRPDDGCDLPDVSSVSELRSDLTEQLDRINRFVPASRHDDVFSHIAEGCTIREAIAKVRASVSAEVHPQELRVAEG